MGLGLGSGSVVRARVGVRVRVGVHTAVRSHLRVALTLTLILTLTLALTSQLTSPTELPVIAHAVAATPAHGGSETARARPTDQANCEIAPCRLRATIIAPG